MEDSDKRKPVSSKRHSSPRFRCEHFDDCDWVLTFDGHMLGMATGHSQCKEAAKHLNETGAGSYLIYLISKKTRAEALEVAANIAKETTRRLRKTQSLSECLIRAESIHLGFKIAYLIEQLAVEEGEVKQGEDHRDQA